MSLNAHLLNSLHFSPVCETTFKICFTG